MFSTRLASQHLLDIANGTSQLHPPVKTKPQGIILLIFFTGLFFWVINGYNSVSAEQAKIAIVLPSTASQVSESDVQYARAIGKRFNQMLRSIGFSADMLAEGSLSKAQLRSRRLIILPLNSEVSTRTAEILNAFVRDGGRLFVTYNLADTIAPLLGVRQTDWLKNDPPGRFSSVQLNAPGIANMPTSVRQASWNVTVAEPTTPQTKIIGYWHDATGRSTGLPALFISETGVFLVMFFSQTTSKPRHGCLQHS